MGKHQGQLVGGVGWNVGESLYCISVGGNGGAEEAGLRLVSLNNLIRLMGMRAIPKLSGIWP